MARITRKELKSDKFALEVEQTVTFFEEHQKDILRYGAIAVSVIVVVAGIFWYRSHQQGVREAALASAIQIQEAPVGPAAQPGRPSYPTQDAKEQAEIAALTRVYQEYGGSTEGQIAQYYIGGIKADQGKLAEAEKSFKEVADRGDAKYSSLAKLSLAQIYFADGRAEQGEKLLRDVMAHPTIFVSKDQATIVLARLIGPKKPDEAKKLLEPLTKQGNAIGQVAITALGELNQ